MERREQFERAPHRLSKIFPIPGALLFANLDSYLMSDRQAPEVEGLPRAGREMTVDGSGAAILKKLYVNTIPAEEFVPARRTTFVESADRLPPRRLTQKSV